MEQEQQKQSESETTPDVARKKGRKRQWKKAFLDAFKQIGIVAPAAAIAGISRDAVRMATIRDPNFAEQYKEALEQSTERLESIAYTRASRTQDPSDTLLIFMLKARKPAVYRDNYRIEHSGPDGAPIMPVTVPTVILLPRDGFEELAKNYGEGPQNPTEPGPTA